jgi:ubiquinone/menaquinone biosynthesis C-methylase UbiE
MAALLNVLRVIGYIILGFGAYQVILRFVRRNWHFPAPSFITLFLNSRLRAKMQDPERLIERSGIKPGQRVLEIGCGGGFFLPYAARAVGAEGHVIGLDIDEKMLEKSLSHLSQTPAQIRERVELIQRSAYYLPFDDASLDVVYLVAALMEIPEPKRCLKEARRVLKPEGVLAVSEFMPDPDYPTRRVTIRTAEEAGFTVDAVEGNAWAYTVRFKKA